jgi:hypothetical protein
MISRRKELDLVRCDACPDRPVLPTVGEINTSRCIRCQGKDRTLPTPHPEGHLCAVCRRECPDCGALTPRRPVSDLIRPVPHLPWPTVRAARGTGRAQGVPLPQGLQEEPAVGADLHPPLLGGSSERGLDDIAVVVGQPQAGQRCLGVGMRRVQGRLGRWRLFLRYAVRPGLTGDPRQAGCRARR